jgi:uncharacterized repeat protein (TIGR03806 family)
MDMRVPLCLTLLIAGLVGHAAGRATPAWAQQTREGVEKPHGLVRRTPWLGSRVVGSPEPPSGYITERAFAKLKFDRPLDLARWPGGERWVVAEDSGTLSTFVNAPDVAQAEPLFVAAGKERAWPAHRRIWSFTFHPRFTKNGYFYVCYQESKPNPARCRISRFHVDPKLGDAAPQAHADSEHIVCEWLAGEDHFGGCLKFGPDGMLYFPVGDGSGYADGNQSGQDLSDFQASVLRIDVDKTELGKAYAVPPDNPFVGRPGVRPEIWAYGTRNIWRMSFDRETGWLWAGDVGQDLWDLVLRVERGGNYGWSVKEGTHPFRPERPVGPTPILPPVAEHDHSEFRSITGGFVYRGKAMPALVGTYVYGDFDTGKIWGLRYDGQRVTEQRELVDTALRIVSFAEDHAGELFMVDYTGGIHRLAPRPPATTDPTPERFPRKLSETGLFASTSEHQPAPGVVPYEVNAPLWSDHASKERFLAIPGDARIEYHPTESWKFPEGSVLVKTFALELERGNPASRRRLETRLLHLEEDHWRGYTYVWNDDQTDAELLGRGSLEREFTIRDPQAPGGERKQTERKQTWRFPSRAECTLCHTMPARFVLGLNTPQMNRDHDYGGVVDNQIRALEHAGYFSQPVAKQHPPEKPTPDKPMPDDVWSRLPRLTDPHDAAAPLDARARSYLHANCAHCHVKWGGGNALFQLTHTLPPAATGTIGVRASHGDFGIANARILTPGAPERSLLWHRMTLTGRGRMPHVGSSVTDEPGVALIRQWIAELHGTR